MSLIVFQHQSDETSSTLGQTLAKHGHKLRTIELFEGDRVPPDFDDVDGVISMGGAMDVDQKDAYPWIEQEMNYLRRAHEAGLPIVGICLGAQLIAEALGGTVGKMDKPEVGWAEVKLAFPGTIDPVYAGIPWQTMQMHMHGCEVKELPADSTPLASSAMCKTQAFKVGLTTYALQYHPEWTRKEIEYWATVPFVEKAGVAAEDIVTGCDEHYEIYRHLGDRFAERMAQILFPLDKRYDRGAPGPTRTHP